MDTAVNKLSSRHTGIDILRIVLMLQILFLHISLHGGLTDVALEKGGRFELVYWIIWITCRCPVYVFIMITGYYLSSTDFPINKKRIVKVYLPMLFYSIMIRVVYGLMRPGTLNYKQYIKALFPFVSKHWYFMTLYLLLIVLAPFLNNAVRSLTRTRFLILLGVCFFLFSIMQPLSKLEPFSFYVHINHIVNTDTGKSLYDFIFMYLVGAYLRRYRILVKDEKSDHKTIWDSPWVYLGMFFICVILNLILVYYYPDKNITNVLIYNDNPVTVIQGICLFRIFENIRLERFPKVGEIAQFISKGMLGIYMIQEHPNTREVIWKELFNVRDLTIKGGLKFFILVFGIVVLVFSVLWLIDLVGRRVFERVIRLQKTL